MRICYSGERVNAYNGGTFRSGSIYYNVENNHDCQIAEYVLNALKISGWDCHMTGSGTAEVIVTDREEYKLLLEEYKDARRGARLNAKFFPKRSKLYLGID